VPAGILALEPFAVAVGRRFRGGFEGGAPTPKMVARGDGCYSIFGLSNLTLEPEGAGEGWVP
jgi:hypothetical protein